MHAMDGAGKWRSSEASTSSTLIVARSRGRLCSPVLEGVPPQSSRLGAESVSGPLRLSFSRTRCPSRAGASEHFRQRSTVPYLCLLTRFLTKVGITGLETAGWGCLLTPFANFGHGLGTLFCLFVFSYVARQAVSRAGRLLRTVAVAVGMPCARDLSSRLCSESAPPTPCGLGCEGL